MPMRCRKRLGSERVQKSLLGGGGHLRRCLDGCEHHQGHRQRVAEGHSAEDHHVLGGLKRWAEEEDERA